MRESVVVEVAAHTAHVLLAGAWLGGVVFTMFVVSPAFRAMKWSEAERVGVRSVVGRKYARVAGVNLSLLALFAFLDGWLSGFGGLFYAEYALLVVLFGLVAVHGAYFGGRIGELAASEREAKDEEGARVFAQKRRSLQRVSYRVSVVDLCVSAAVMAISVNASGGI